jgi:hypothetical protein
MAGLFGGPKIPAPVPVVNPADSQNRLNDQLAAKLSQGGTNADVIGNQVAPMPMSRPATLTGIQ